MAGNAENLNAAIRRASPALRETDKVLATLGAQNQILADLTVNADKVVGDLAANRKDVGRFVTEAKDTAQASAERRGDIAAGFRELPGFLEQLQPTMKALGQVADDQGSALHNLDSSSKQLTTFFDQLGPFADASRPAFRSLGSASKTGDRAVKAAPPVISQLGAFASGTPELGKNLSIVLQHLDDRKYAVEKDPRSPGGQGYTGLEALLQYAYDQTTSTSIFDQNNHILKIGAFVGPCADYASEETLKKNPDLERQCGSRLGPDPARPQLPRRHQARGARTPRTAGRAKRAERRPRPAAARRPGARRRPPPAPATPATPSTPALPSVPTPSTPTVPTPTVPGVPPINLPPLPGVGGTGGNGRGGSSPLPPLPPLPKLSAKTSHPQAQTKLLDYLLKP